MATASLHSWEDTLRSLAGEATAPGTAAGQTPLYDPRLLRRAYAACDGVTACHSRTFHLASGLLPPAKCQAIRALYAFCRRVDDLVDGGAPGAAEALTEWRRRTAIAQPPPDDLVAVAWSDTRARYGIPHRYAEQLMDGAERDLVCHRYATFEDLASTVGLMSMHIIGYCSDEAIPYAIKLGVALQLTNILRDVQEDWVLGRVYLPLDELVAYRLTQADLAAGQVDDRWRAFMGFQIARARRLYDEAWPGIGLLHRDGRFAIAAAGGLYRAILDDIERHDYDVFHRRAHVSAVGKLRRLPSLWLRAH
jgi:15-cis-phytoene synthase